MYNILYTVIFTYTYLHNQLLWWRLSENGEGTSLKRRLVNGFTMGWADGPCGFKATFWANSDMEIWSNKLSICPTVVIYPHPCAMEHGPSLEDVPHKPPFSLGIFPLPCLKTRGYLHPSCNVMVSFLHRYPSKLLQSKPWHGDWDQDLQSSIVNSNRSQQIFNRFQQISTDSYRFQQSDSVGFDSSPDIHWTPCPPCPSPSLCWCAAHRLLQLRPVRATRALCGDGDWEISSDKVICVYVHGL